MNYPQISQITQIRKQEADRQEADGVSNAVSYIQAPRLLILSCLCNLCNLWIILL